MLIAQGVDFHPLLFYSTFVETNTHIMWDEIQDMPGEIFDLQDVILDLEDFLDSINDDTEDDA